MKFEIPIDMPIFAARFPPTRSEIALALRGCRRDVQLRAQEMAEKYFKTRNVCVRFLSVERVGSYDPTAMFYGAPNFEE